MKFLLVCGIISNVTVAEVVELADALDSKSSGAHTPCGFDSRLRHQFKNQGFSGLPPQTESGGSEGGYFYAENFQIKP